MSFPVRCSLLCPFFNVQSNKKAALALFHFIAFALVTTQMGMSTNKNKVPKGQMYTIFFVQYFLIIVSKLVC